MGKTLLKIIRNKYFLTVVGLAAWLLFFDKNDLFSQFDRHKEVKKLENEVKYYQQKIAQNKQEINELQSDPKLLEKFARERFLMKRDSEDIFVIIRDTLR